MVRGSLSKRLFSLLLSIIMVVESGITPGITGYATENSAEPISAMYEIMAVGSPEKITVKYGTDISKIKFPKAAYALARKKAEDSDDEEYEEEYTASPSSVKEDKRGKTGKASDSDISKSASSEKRSSRIEASGSETDKVSSKSELNKNIDFMTDKQKSTVISLLSRSSMPEISEIEENTGLDLKGYKVIKLKYGSWENDPSFGLYDSQKADTYRFEASLTEDSKYEYFNGTDTAAITVEVLPENASPSFIYPVYVKTQNVTAGDELDFSIGDVDFGENIKVYTEDSDFSNRNEIEVRDNTFSLPVAGNKSEYFLSIETNDDEINLKISTDKTDYQNSAGTGKDPLSLKKAYSDSDHKENCFMVLGKSSNIPLTVHWEDGGRDKDSKNNLVGQNIHELLYLEYFIDGISTGWKRLNQDSMKEELGFSGEIPVASPSDLDEKTLAVVFNPTTVSYNFRDSLYDSLTTRDPDTGELISHPVRYRIAPEDKLSLNYFSTFEDEYGNDDTNGTILRNYEIKTFTATVKWNDTAKKSKGINSERPSKEDWKNHIHLQKVLKGDAADTKTVDIHPGSENAEGALVISDKSSDEWLISIRGYGYDRDNYPIHYYITEDAITLSDDTGSEGNIIKNRHYEAEYKNEDNASDRTTALYDGGTLVNVLSGETNFAVNCEWKDEGDDNTMKGRPTVSVKLYRYAKDDKITNSSRWSNLSPVQGADYEAVTESSGACKTAQNKHYRLSLPREGTLDAYNQEGAELIYTGKVKKQGGTSKYKTSLKTRSGNIGELYQGYFVFNDDTIENLIEGSINVTASKTWNAAARQDVESEVTLSLYQTTKKPKDDASAYSSATKLPHTLKLDGFTSEIQSKSTSSVLPKYDENGNKLYYLAKEEKVATKVTDAVTNTSSFRDAVLYKEKGNDYILTSDGYRYLQTIDYSGNKTSEDTETTGKSGSSETNSTVSSEDQTINITNTLIGDAEILISKTFSEGLSEQDKKTLENENGEVSFTFNIYRNKEKIGKIKRTYKKGAILTAYDSDGNPTETVIKDEAQLYKKFKDQILITSYDELDQSEIKEADRKTGLLPRYDERGVEYRYTVYEETGVSDRGYYPTVHNSIIELSRDKTLPGYVETHIEKYLCSCTAITNCTKEQNLISVYKEWLDGGDSGGRDPVSFTLQVKENGTWKTISEKTIDPAVESYIYIEIPDEYSETYKKWRDNRKSGIKNSDYDFRVTETHAGKVNTDENMVHYYTGTGPSAKDDFASRPDIYLAHELSKSKADADELAQKKDADDVSDSNGLVKGDNYIYDVFLNDNAGIKRSDIPQSFDFTITNRRIGVVYLEINAGNWLDGVLKDKARPDSLSLSVMMGDEEKAVTLNEENGWKASFGPFRKYDDDGELINYNPHIKAVNGKTVNYIYSEKRKENEEAFAGAYVLEITEALTLKPYHTGDIYSFNIKNELKQSIIPTVNKYWEDSDSKDGKSNKRPDIVMNLYRTYTDKDEVCHVEQIDKNKYINYEWDTNKDLYHNFWQLSYAPQPRFSPGDYYEYTYYIRESMTSGENNEYVEIGAFSGSPELKDNISDYSYDPSHPEILKLDKDTAVSAAKVSIDPDNAMTIVNRKRNKRTVSGVKVYNNLPSGFKAENLPKIKLELWRKTVGSETEEPVYEYVQDKDALGHDTLVPKTDGKILTTVLGSADANGETKFYFNNSDGSRAEVPKYDDKGQLYIYTIREVGDTEDSEESKLLHHLFELTTNDSLTNGIVATNGYKTDTGYEITFYKKWEGLELLKKDLNSDTVKPSITIRLYRYLQNESGIIAGSDEVVTVKETGSEITDIVLNYDASHPEYTSYTWNVPYYAPNLNPYVYVVSEKTGEETVGYGEVYDAELKDKTGKLSLKSGNNLYGNDTEISKIFSSKIGGKVSHKGSWTGYDTLVTGSYEINISDAYKGKGHGTAGLVNVYTGVPKASDESFDISSSGSGKDPAVKKNSTDEPKTIPEEPKESSDQPEPEIPETKPVDPEPKKNNGTGSSSGGGNSSGGKSTVSYSGSLTFDDNDDDDIKLPKTLAALNDIDVPKVQDDPGLRMLLSGVSDSTDMMSEDDKAVLEAKRAMTGAENTDTAVAGGFRSPKTGDESRMFFYGILSLISALILGSWCIYKKKKM